MDLRNLRRRVRLFVAGFIMGAADIVPGVSGGTMAFILGIYDGLIDAIRRCTSPEAFRMIFALRLREAFRTLPWAFLLTLGLGILSAIVVLSTPLKWMLEHRLSWIVVGLSQLQSPPDGMWYLVLCGAVAISAMILPGISGSFILLLMGRYECVLNAVHQLRCGVEIPRQLAVLALFALGVALGIAGFIRLLAWLLRRFHDITIALLIGFMIGSLRKVWPWKEGGRIENANLMPDSFNGGFWIAAALALAGLLLVLGIEYAARRLENPADPKAEARKQ